MLQPVLIALFCLVAMNARPASSQQESGSTGQVTISARIGGKSYESAAQGSCRHTAAASIYGVPAALWMVGLTGSAAAGIESLNLTLWKPKNGSPEQFSVSLTTKSSSHRMDVGGRGEQVGSGKASVLPIGAGGRIEVSGKDDSGKTIELVVKCPAFAGVEAEGG